MVNIKQLRGKHQITQIDVSKMLGLSRTTIINAENNSSYLLSEVSARKLSDYFGVPVFDLIDVESCLPYKPKTKEEWEAIERQIKEKIANAEK